MKLQVKASQRVNLWLALQRHFKAILLLGILTFAAAAPYSYFVLSTRTYSSAVELRIDPTTDAVVPGVDYSSSNSMGQYYSAYVATQKFKILKVQNIIKALQSLSPDARVALIGDRPINNTTADDLAQRTVIIPSYDSLILSVLVSGNKPQGLAEYLNALTNVYLEEMRTEKTNLENNRIDFASRQLTVLQEQIDQTTARIRQISETTSTGNFNPEDIPYRNEFKIQEETALRAENDRILKENTYTQFVTQMASSAKLDIDSQTEEKMANDQVLSSKKRPILAKLEAISNSTTKSQEQANTESSVLQQQLNDLDATYRARYRAEVQAEIKSSLEKQKLQLYSAYMVAKQYEDAVKKSFAVIREKYSSTSRLILEAKDLQQDLIGLKAQADKVNGNITYFQGEQQGNGHVTVENYATTPTVPDKSTLPKNLTMAFLVSFFWAPAFFLLREFFDRRVKSAEELKSFTGIKPSWPLSHFPKGFLGVHMETEDSVVKKAIRSLATRINRERQDFQAKVVTFNGIDHRVGCTEILINCAYAMTDNCEGILVIDLNRETPAIAKKLGIPKKTLPTAKDLETMNLETAVSRDPVRGFDVLAVQNPERLENKNVERILQLARDRYDIVFLDAAPVFRSSSTEFVLPMSDVVVFVVLGNKTTYSDLGQSLELAQKLGVNSAALVLNWWRPDPKEEKYQDSSEPT